MVISNMHHRRKDRRLRQVISFSLDKISELRQYYAHSNHADNNKSTVPADLKISALRYKEFEWKWGEDEPRITFPPSLSSSISLSFTFSTSYSTHPVFITYCLVREWTWMRLIRRLDRNRMRNETTHESVWKVLWRNISALCVYNTFEPWTMT